MGYSSLRLKCKSVQWGLIIIFGAALIGCSDSDTGKTQADNGDAATNPETRATTEQADPTRAQGAATANPFAGSGPDVATPPPASSAAPPATPSAAAPPATPPVPAQSATEKTQAMASRPLTDEDIEKWSKIMTELAKPAQAGGAVDLNTAAATAGTTAAEYNIINSRVLIAVAAIQREDFLHLTDSPKTPDSDIVRKHMDEIRAALSLPR